jgi:RNA polymerase sigma factor (sigma-70 family)
MQKKNGLSDEELVQRAQKGSQDAFAELYERYLPGVYARVRFKVPTFEVEDITQEIFIATVKGLSQFKGEAKFSTWLWTLTSRKIADYYRSSRYTLARKSEEVDAVEQTARTNNNQSEHPQDERLVVECALGKLPAVYQEILLMRFVDEIPFSEIASQKGQTLEAVKSLFRRSVAALRKEMEQT